MEVVRSRQTGRGVRFCRKSPKGELKLIIEPIASLHSTLSPLSIVTRIKSRTCTPHSLSSSSSELGLQASLEGKKDVL